MRREVTCDYDGFEFALKNILNEVDYEIAESLHEPIRKSLKKGKDELVRKSSVKTGGYAKGWAYTMKGRKNGVFGEIGNRDKPGLVHLLEKGHARIGGGREVPPSPSGGHVAPVAEKLFDELEADVLKSIEKALSK